MLFRSTLSAAKAVCAGVEAARIAGRVDLSSIELGALVLVADDVVGVADFLKRTSLVACTPDALAALGPAALAMADAEGLGAHGRSVSIRLNRRP